MNYLCAGGIYTKDEWEVNRSDIEIIREIGHGLFGKVFYGKGRDVSERKVFQSNHNSLQILSQCGMRFGECAVKIVSDTASVYDRYVFLQVTRK